MVPDYPYLPDSVLKAGLQRLKQTHVSDEGLQEGTGLKKSMKLSRPAR